ncbi:hypothetical protein M407DRAFT_28951 [Tulasnella calospora MUT 4182]|uniref:Uncharacterized protein n=1 Tax=Tulasnella calospora MUT 4182 TaxID=1051891 RepID=A0A0C3Q0E1_9AGAM|nr:hypothetical protein M407DRAFT_28951 [Tulasnella calospora MUT 4182]
MDAPVNQNPTNAEGALPDVTLQDIRQMEGVLSLLQRLAAQAAAVQQAPPANTTTEGVSTAAQDPTALGGRVTSTTLRPESHLNILNKIVQSDPSSSTASIPSNLGRSKYSALGTNVAQQPTAEGSSSTSAQPPPDLRITTNIGIQPTDRHQAEMLVLDPKSRVGQKMRSKLRNMNDGDEEQQNEARLALAAWADEDKDTMNAHVKRRRESLLYMWKYILGANPWHVPESELWTEEVVRKHAAYFLTFRAHHSQGRKGKHILARTLIGWLTDLCWAICRFTRSKTGQRCGLTLLVDGLYAKLDATCIALTRKLDLQRLPVKQKFINMEEVFMLVQLALEEGEENGCLLRLQQICAMVLTFATTVRPSSLAPSNSSYAKSGQYMKLGDITHTREGWMRFTSTVSINNFKGHNTGPIGKRLIFTLHPTEQPEFVLLTNWCLILYQHLRGAFGFSSLKELMEYEGATLEALPEKQNEPFFVKGTEGGRGLDPNLAVTTSMSLSAAIAQLCRKLGFGIGATLRGIRRGSANIFGLKLGAKIAANILAHGIRTSRTFMDFYSLNTENIPVLSVLFDEIPLPPDRQALYKKARETQFFSSLAVMSIVKRNALEFGLSNYQEVKPIELPPYSPEDKEWCQEQENESEVSAERKEKLSVAYENWEKDDPAAQAPSDRDAKWTKLFQKVENIIDVPIYSRHSGYLPAAIIKLAKRAAELKKEPLDDDISFDELPASSHILFHAFREHREAQKLIRRRCDDRIRDRLSDARPAKDTTAARYHAQMLLKGVGAAPVEQALQTVNDDAQPSNSRPSEQDRPIQLQGEAVIQQGVNFQVVDPDLYQLAVGEVAGAEDPDNQFDNDLSPQMFGGFAGQKLVGLVKTTRDRLREVTKKANPPGSTEDAEIPDVPVPAECADDDTGDDLAVFSKDGEDVRGSCKMGDGSESSVFKTVPAAEVFAALMWHVNSIVEKQLQTQEEARVARETGVFCVKCDFTTDTAGHLERHMQQMHTPWKDLERDSATDDPNVFACPKCGGNYPNLSSILAHGVRDCPEKEWFRSMRWEGASGIDAAGAGSADSIVKQLLQQHTTGRGKIWHHLSQEEEATWRGIVDESVKFGLTFDPTPIPEGMDPDGDDDLGMVGGSRAVEVLEGLMRNSSASAALEQFGVIPPRSEEGQNDG